MEDGSRDVHAEVRHHYGRVARGETSEAGCCGGTPCGTSASVLGYSEAERASVPDGADLGLGCGNPQAIASLRRGETVLDLGCGGGFDAFLAARQVGPEGRVIGVDMTPDMIARARANAGRIGARNVEFRLGEIEHLPLPDCSVDVILSNCVVNLTPDKQAVYREALRVLKPGGRIAIMDVVATAPVPDRVRSAAGAVSACVAGAAHKDEIAPMLTSLGFEAVHVEIHRGSEAFIKDWLPGSGAERFIVSAAIRATRPVGDACCGTAPKAPCC